jgi:hypothetical protein
MSFDIPMRHSYTVQEYQSMAVLARVHGTLYDVLAWCERNHYALQCLNIRQCYVRSLARTDRP